MRRHFEISPKSRDNENGQYLGVKRTIHGFIVLLFMSLVFNVRVNTLARVKLKVTKADIGESMKFFFHLQYV